MSRSKITPEVFDRDADWSMTQRRLPHWTQSETLTFITFRLFDSIPRHILKQWHLDRDAWLQDHNIKIASDGPTELDSLSPRLRLEYESHFAKNWQGNLDDCHGECWLRDPAIASIVEQSLLHFQGVRYLVTDFIIMPNHVHLIAAFESGDAMLKQCTSWKHFSAVKINQALQRTGQVWQQDGFDHLIRSEEQLRYLKAYMRDNPTRANLRQNEFVYFSLNERDEDDGNRSK